MRIVIRETRSGGSLFFDRLRQPDNRQLKPTAQSSFIGIHGFASLPLDKFAFIVAIVHYCKRTRSAACRVKLFNSVGTCLSI